jgi:hypothetical protein
MAPGTTHEATFCCGGGGGLLTDDLLELRVKGALPRMEALKNVVDEQGVNFMATICAICKAQFSKVLPILRLRHGHGRRRAPAGQHPPGRAIRPGEPARKTATTHEPSGPTPKAPARTRSWRLPCRATPPPPSR